MNRKQIYWIGKNLTVPEKYNVTISFGYILDHFDVNYENFSIKTANSPNISEYSNIFIRKTPLTNDTDPAQTLSTNSFSKAIINSISNRTTLGFKYVYDMTFNQIANRVWNKISVNARAINKRD